MKFSCLKENLSNGLQIVYRAIPTKGNANILSNVLIETEKGRLKLSATNMETTITTYIGASVEKEGSITVPAKLLRDFVSTLSTERIDAELNKVMLNIESGNTKARINGLTSEDFPTLPTFPENEENIKLDPKTLFDAISLVSFSAGNDESRRILTGIYLNLDKEDLTITSSDGFRLSEKKIKVDNKNKKFSAIVPSKTLSEISRIFSNATEPIEFSLNEKSNLAMFKCEDTFVSCRVIDGNYIDYERIIPKSHQMSSTFNTAEFEEAVKLTYIFEKNESNDKNEMKTIRVRFDPEGLIKVSSILGESGKNETEIEAEVDGSMLEISFSSKNLLDYLNYVKSEKTTFETESNTAPCVFNPLEIESYTHLIMPVQQS